jgi:hypothetical protein
LGGQPAAAGSWLILCSQPEYLNIESPPFFTAPNIHRTHVASVGQTPSGVAISLDASPCASVYAIPRCTLWGRYASMSRRRSYMAFYGFTGTYSREIPASRSAFKCNAALRTRCAVRTPAGSACSTPCRRAFCRYSDIPRGSAWVGAWSLC